MTSQAIDQDLVGFVEELADAATAAILPHFRTALSIENKADKSPYDPVTIADRAAELAMRARIEARFPDDGILGEEFGTVRGDASRLWVLDPIDGTKAFVAGLPVWGVLIGLIEDGRPRLGMMCQPFTGERFAGDGAHAWYRGPDGHRDLRTRPCGALADALLFTTTPALFSADERPLYDRVEAEARLARYGTDCYAYCMVASGHADVVVEAGLAPYDVIALIPIIEGAGGVMTTWDGGPATAGGRIVAAGDPRLHEIVLKRLSI